LAGHIRADYLDGRRRYGGIGTKCFSKLVDGSQQGKSQSAYGFAKET
jgi:hypothetical protein